MPIYNHFRYTEKDDFIIIRAYCGDDVDVIVPDIIKGKPVQEISPHAFVPESDQWHVGCHDSKKHCSNRVRSIRLPDTIQRLEGAFACCFELEEITLPCNAELIGTDNFHQCYALKAIYVDSNNSSYMSKNGILYSKDGKQLLRCPSDHAIDSNDYLDGVEVIAPSAFQFCKNLLTIAIPTSVISVGSSAFTNCHNLEFVHLHEEIHLVGAAHFWCCSSLDNVIYYNAEGIIPRGEFCHCKNLNNIDIRSKIRIIGEHAFSDTGLIDFVVPKGTSAINAYAFLHCYSLKSIVIPRSTSRIHKNAFTGCGRNYYTEEQCADIHTCFGMDPATTFIVIPGSKAEAFCQAQGYKILHP